MNEDFLIFLLGCFTGCLMMAVASFFKDWRYK